RRPRLVHGLPDPPPRTGDRALRPPVPGDPPAARPGKHIYAALDPDPADSQRIQASPGSATQASADGSAGVRGPGDQGIGELDEDGRHSFGFFGAVTSAISIVPDVRGRTESGQHPDSPGNTRSSGSGGSVH